MRIITQAIRVIDYENNKISTRNIMPKFGEYIEQLISYINGNLDIFLLEVVQGIRILNINR